MLGRHLQCICEKYKSDQHCHPVVVVFAFFFCWTPFHAQRLMFVVVTLLGTWTPTLHSVQHILFTYSGESSLCISQLFTNARIKIEKSSNLNLSTVLFKKRGLTFNLKEQHFLFGNQIKIKTNLNCQQTKTIFYYIFIFQEFVSWP